VKWNEGRIEIIVVNDGRMNVKHVTVQILFPEQETWKVTINRLEPSSKRFIEFIPSPHLPEGEGWVVVDPDDEIKERREDNNRLQLPIRAVKPEGKSHR
jgi:hypothetical protein